MFSCDETYLLGVGHFSKVFRGTWQGQPAAVKKINLSAHYDSLEALRREGQIQVKLAHPNIVQLFMSKQQANVLYYVLELMEAADLCEMVYTYKIPLGPLACLRIAQDMVAGLDYLHAQGFLHRDIKPENILFNHRMEAKIADFGYAVEVSHVDTSELVGTKCYLAPEIALAAQMEGRKHYPYHPLTDIYALGLTLLFLVCRDNPYGKSVGEISFADIAAPRLYPIPKETPKILADVIAGCLRIYPECRLNAQGIIQLFAALLPEEQAKISHVNTLNYPMLYFASKNGRLDILEELMASDVLLPVMNDACNAERYAPLHLAAKGGHKDFCQHLLEKGADINLDGPGGDSALTLAAEKGYAEICTLLLEKGADIRKKNRHGIRAEYLWSVKARQNNPFTKLREDLVHLVQDDETLSSDRQKTLSELIYVHNPHLLAWPIQSEGDLENFINMAIMVNNKRELRNLMNHPQWPALSQTRTRRGFTILHFMAGSDRRTLEVDYEKINVNDSQNVQGWSPLHLAARAGHAAFCLRLLANGARLNLQDNEGYTALAWAAKNGHAEVCQLLLSAGADVTLKNKQGKTADALWSVGSQEENFFIPFCRGRALVQKKEKIQDLLNTKISKASMWTSGLSFFSYTGAISDLSQTIHQVEFAQGANRFQTEDELLIQVIDTWAKSARKDKVNFKEKLSQEVKVFMKR